MDISTACIDIANKSSKIPGVEYNLGNMQDLSSYSNKFDCTLNLFSSFGYFSNDTENEAVLDEMIKTLRTSGKLVLNLVNRDFLLSIYKPASWFKAGPVITINAGSYDPQTHYNESYMTLKNEETGETTLSYHRIRLYSAEEIVGLLKRNGLKDVQVFGDYRGSELNKIKSTHPFFIGTKS